VAELPPPAGVPLVSPIIERADAPGGAPPPRRRRVLPIILGALGLCVVVAVAVVAVRALMGGGTSGGASSPETAVTDLVTALNGDDFLAASSYIAPDEVPGLEKLVTGVQDGAKRTGITTGGSGVDLNLDLAVVDVEELSDDAALVTVEGTAELKDGESATELLRDWLPVGASGSTDELDIRSIDDRTVEPAVVVIRIDGGWYVSPLLSTAELVRAVLELPAGDFEQVAAPDDRGSGAESGEEAVTGLFEALADKDPDALAGALASGEARLVRVYQDAIEEVLDDPVVQRYEIELDDVRTREGYIGDEDHGVLVPQMDFEVTDLEGGGRWSVALDGRCVEGRRLDVDEGTARSCALENDALRTRLGLESLPLAIVDADGGQRVSLTQTIGDLIRMFSTTLERNEILEATGAEYTEEAQPITLGTPVEGEFAGSPFAVYELALEAGDGVSFGAIDTDEDADLDVELVAPGGERATYPYEATEDGMHRLVVRSPNTCDDWAWISGCSLGSGEGRYSLFVHPVRYEQAASPLDVQGEVEPFEQVVLEFDVDRTQAWDVSLQGAAEFSWAGNTTGNCSCVGTRWLLEPGHYRMDVGWSSEASSFAVHATEVPVVGFDDGSLSRSVSLGPDGVRLPLYLESGRSWSVRASPMESQDIVLTILDYDGSSQACFADAGAGGGAESCSFNPAPMDGSVTVVVTPYSPSSDAYGEVLVEATFD
jgi:hypothetical protein